MKGIFSSRFSFPGISCLACVKIVETAPDVEIAPDGVGFAKHHGALAPGTESLSLITQRHVVSVFSATDSGSGKRLCLKRWQVKPIKTNVFGPCGSFGVLKLVQRQQAHAEMAKREFAIMRSLDSLSDYFVQAYEIISSGCFVFLSMELMEMDLCELFLKLDKKYDFGHGNDGEGRNLFYGARLLVLFPILKALHHLENIGIVHKDIKPDNIFVKSPGPSIKLGDFGGAYRMRKVKSKLALEKFKSKFAEYGTDFYVSPEVKEFAKCNYASDIWSLGMTLVLASHHPPATELLKRDMIWRYDGYRPKLFPIRSLFKKALTLKEISMVDATKLLHDHLFEVYPEEEVDTEASVLLKEVYHLAGCMLRFSPEERPSASDLLAPRVNTPNWSSICLGWEIEGTETSPRIFKTVQECFLELLQT